MLIIGLKGERVRLVPPDRTLHLENALIWINDPEITAALKYNFGMTRRQEELVFEKMETQRENDFTWAILDEAERHIGFIGLHAINWRHRWATGGLSSASVRHGAEAIRRMPSGSGLSSPSTPWGSTGSKATP